MYCYVSIVRKCKRGLECPDGLNDARNVKNRFYTPKYLKGYSYINNRSNSRISKDYRLFMFNKYRSTHAK